METETIHAKVNKQDVPEGYKRTEAGVIPMDWEVISLGDYINLKNGFAFSSSFFSNVGPIVITPGNFKLEGGIKLYTPKTIHYRGKYDKEMVFTEGDLLIVMTDLTPDCNLLGKSGIIKNYKEVVLHNQRIGKIIIKSNKIDKHYLCNYFNSIYFSNWMKSTATGSTVRHTSVSSIKKTILLLPSLSEQRAIATALSDTDNLIESLEKLIAKKIDIKKACMQQLLTGKKRLPGFEGEWEVKRLGDVATFLKGSGLSKTDLSSDGVNKCIHYGELFTTYEEKIKRVVSRTNYNYTVLSKKNDVLMPTSDVTPNGLATASYITFSNVILGGDILIIRTSEDILNGEFLAYSIKMNRDKIMKLVSGTTVYHLYGKEMKNFYFLAPSIQEQREIVNILSDMDNEIEALEQRLEKTKQIKQGMMQELLTGRIRLNH